MNQTRVSKSEFKSRALEFFRKVEANGEALIVTDHGKPCIEVRRYRKTTQPAPLDALKGSVTKYIEPLEPVGDNDWGALR